MINLLYFPYNTRHHLLEAGHWRICSKLLLETVFDLVVSAMVGYFLMAKGMH